MEAHFLPYLIEDRAQGWQSYTDYLTTLHKNVLTTKG